MGVSSPCVDFGDEGIFLKEGALLLRFLCAFSGIPRRYWQRQRDTVDVTRKKEDLDLDLFFENSNGAGEPAFLVAASQRRALQHHGSFYYYPLAQC
jgi:hypothetical protein